MAAPQAKGNWHCWSQGSAPDSPGLTWLSAKEEGLLFRARTGYHWVQLGQSQNLSANPWQATNIIPALPWQCTRMTIKFKKWDSERSLLPINSHHSSPSSDRTAPGLRPTQLYFANGPGDSEADRDYCALIKVGKQASEPAGYSCHNLNTVILCGGFSHYTTSFWFSLNAIPAQGPFPEGLGLWPGECASGHLGFTQPSVFSEASAVFVLFVFPILNYASGKLCQFLAKEGKNGFLKPCFELHHHCLYIFKLVIFWSRHPSIGAQLAAAHCEALCLAPHARAPCDFNRH